MNPANRLEALQELKVMKEGAGSNGKTSYCNVDVRDLRNQAIFHLWHTMSVGEYSMVKAFAAQVGLMRGSGPGKSHRNEASRSGFNHILFCKDVAGYLKARLKHRADTIK